MAPGDFVGDGLGYEGGMPCHLVKISAARTSGYALGNPHMPDSWPIPSGRRRFPPTSFAGGGAAGVVARAPGSMLGPLQLNSPRSSECVGQSVSLRSGSFIRPVTSHQQEMPRAPLIGHHREPLGTVATPSANGHEFLLARGPEATRSVMTALFRRVRTLRATAGRPPRLAVRLSAFHADGKNPPECSG